MLAPNCSLLNHTECIYTTSMCIHNQHSMYMRHTYIHTYMYTQSARVTQPYICTNCIIIALHSHPHLHTYTHPHNLSFDTHTHTHTHIHTQTHTLASFPYIACGHTLSRSYARIRTNCISNALHSHPHLHTYLNTPTHTISL